MASMTLLEHISEVFVLELCLVLHACFITPCSVGWPILAIAASVHHKHICCTSSIPRQIFRKDESTYPVEEDGKPF